MALLALATVIYWFWSAGERDLALLFLGATLATVWRDIVWIRLGTRYWPVSDYCTDWTKVDELLSGKAADHESQ